MPSKVASYLAAGKPLVVSATGETADLVTNNRVGLTADPTNPADLAHAIRALAALVLRNVKPWGCVPCNCSTAISTRLTASTPAVSMLEQLGLSWRGGGGPWRGNGEQDRLEGIYESRAYDPTPTTRHQLSYLQRVQSLERQVLDALSVAGLSSTIGSCEVPRLRLRKRPMWMGRWLAGADYRRLHGVDIRESAIDHARTRVPGVDFRSFGRKYPCPTTTRASTS